MMSTSMFVTILLIIDASSAVLHPPSHGSFIDIHGSFNDIHEWVWSVRVGGVVFPGFPFLELGNYDIHTVFNVTICEASRVSLQNCNAQGDNKNPTI